MLKNIVALGFIVLLLTGCFGSPSKVPDDRFYTLKIEGADVVAKKYKRITLHKVKAYGIYNERAMLYSQAAFPLKVRRYHYHHWVMSPAQLIQHGLKDYLRDSKISHEVVISSFSHRNSLQIKTELLAFERIIYKDLHKVRVEIAFELIWPDGKYREHKYSKIVTTKKNTLHAAADAYGVALSEMFKQLLNEL